MRAEGRGLKIRALGDTLAPYREFARVGFINILAFRLRYYTGIITYLINVTVYYFIWTAVYGPALKTAGGTIARGGTIAGYDLGQMLTYVSVGLDHPLVLLEYHRPGNGLRSSRRQDRHGTDQARLGAGDVAGARGRRIRVSPDSSDRAGGRDHRVDFSGARARFRGPLHSFSLRPPRAVSC